MPTARPAALGSASVRGATQAPLALLAGLALTAGAWGFSNYAVGETLPELSLAGLDGAAKRSWLGTQKINVFCFFSPGSKNSQLGLKELAALEKEFAGKPVSFVGLVSSTVPAADAKKDLATQGFTSPVLVDEGDVLYGKLGTALTPVIGISDEKHKLLAYLPFTKIQYQDTIRAWIRFGLGELTEEQLKATLAPPPAVDGGELAIAHRHLKFAERQQKSGNADGALTSLKKSLEHADLAGAHVLLATIHAARGSCAEAAAELKRALELEPGNEPAKAGVTGCGTPDGGGP